METLDPESGHAPPSSSTRSLSAWDGSGSGPSSADGFTSGAVGVPALAVMAHRPGNRSSIDKLKKGGAHAPAKTGDPDRGPRGPDKQLTGRHVVDLHCGAIPAARAATRMAPSEDPWLATSSSL
jgi:hypothetical protein